MNANRAGGVHLKIIADSGGQVIAGRNFSAQKIAVNRAYRQAPIGQLAGVLLVDREKRSTNTKRIEEEPDWEKEPA